MSKIAAKPSIPFFVSATIAFWPAIALCDASSKPLSGEYSIYSGTPAERAIATKKDSKVSISIGGAAASSMFNYLGKGATRLETCEGGETRVRDELMCVRSQPGNETYCYFGFDLHTGKSYLGIAC